MSEILVFGVALKVSPDNPSLIACLCLNEEKLKLLWLDTFYEDRGLLSIVTKYNPRVVAIGSPLSLPVGLHCLEPTCSSCDSSPVNKGRAAERALAQAQIPPFFTIKGSVIQLLIYRGVGLKRELILRQPGLTVIEIYPYATSVRLFGYETPKGGTPERAQFLKEALGQRIEGLEVRNPPRDRSSRKSLWNALLSAYTGFLYTQGKTEELGDPAEGLIIIPRTKKLVTVL